MKLVSVLEVLDNEKGARKDEGGAEAHQHVLVLAKLCRPDGQGHRQAAGDEHERVGGPHGDVERLVCVEERSRIQVSEGGIGHEQTAEEQDLGGQEYPHTELCSRLLLLLRHEVMREELGVIWFCRLYSHS